IIEKLVEELKNIEEGMKEDDKERIAKELGNLDLACANLNHDIEKKNIEIENLKEKIERSHNED
ncbi:MAG: hypothetical protein ACFFCL_13965, partial [Promethearchaeota archaeon]